MLLNTSDYEFLENLVEVNAGMTYGGVIMESTVGRRFLVEMMFTEWEDDYRKGGQSTDKSKVAAQASSAIKKIITKIFGGTYWEVVEGTGTIGETPYKLAQRDVPTIFERVKTLASAFGGKVAKAWTALKNFAKKHPYAAGTALIVFVLVTAYMVIKQRPLLKQIGNFMRKIIVWPFTKMKEGISWVINKILSAWNSSKTESVLIQLAGSATSSFNESVLFTETVLMLEGDDKTEKEKKLLKDNVLRKITQYGFQVPKTFILKMLAKYASLFYSKDNKFDSTKVDEKLKAAKEELSKYKKDVAKDKRDEKTISDLLQNIDKARKDINGASKTYIGEHKKALIISAIVLLVVVAAAIYFYRKKKASTTTQEESFAF
jgi:hypothetical protein